MTLFLTIAYPPNPTASSLVHKNLLNQFDPTSFIVLKGLFLGARKISEPEFVTSKIVYISFEFISSKLHNLIAYFQKFTIPIFLKYFNWKYKPSILVIAYPDLFWVDICSKFALKNNLPFVPYLHDTIIEGLYSSVQKKNARNIQDRIFNNAKSIAVMSEGMRDLYKSKYAIETISWEHIYEEAPDLYVSPKFNRIHWSGDVYEINYKSVKRISEAIVSLNFIFTISNGKSRELLNELGLNAENFKKVFYPERKDYLKHLNDSKFVLLALNYPDECNVHEEELSTIFSTKTPEYLGSNAIIIYNGPSNYFLAKFLKEYNCGVIIDSRDTAYIANKIKDLICNYEAYQYLSLNAKSALRKFNPQIVKQKVIKTMN